jgi:predicted RNase H-like HicB family nuclease
MHDVLIERDHESGVYVAHVPTLNGLSTYGETREAAFTMAREAIIGYLEAAGKAGIDVEREDQ